MREIKFRAWDKQNKRMYFPTSINWDKDCTTLWVCDVKGENKLEYELVQPTSELMQYTGLKDKNEKEIYESDIILDLKGDKRVVEYVDNGFWCSYPNGDHYFPADGYREVIGNVYENSKLIENGLQQESKN